MHIYLVRHGVTRANVEGRYVGRSHDPILDESTKIVEETVEYLSSVCPGRIVSSPLLRAKMTAQLISDDFGLSLEIANELSEIEYGPWSGLLASEIAKRDANNWAAWRSDPYSVAVEGMEQLQSVEARALRWIYSQGVKGPDIVAVTHEPLIKAVLCSLLPGGEENYRKLTVPNCSVQILERRKEGLFLIKKNAFTPTPFSFR